MIHEIYSVRDAKVEAFLQPFFAPTLGSAVRSLTEAVNDKEHTFCKHVDDFALYHIGSFDDARGELLPVPDGPSKVCGLSQLVK